MQRPLALTFDDGPDECCTPAILSALARNRVRATFFMIGERVEACPGLARSVLAAGHDVQLHCHRHIRHTQLSEAEIESDAQAGLRALSAIGGEPVAWRTPWGVRTAGTEAVAARLNLTLHGWEHDSHDWRGDDAAQMLAAIGSGVDAGGSVLMHDGLGPGARRETVVNTVELIDLLVEQARRRGVAIGTLRLEPESCQTSDHELASTEA
jgi:peptidoglycan/xylan/chitin deacetylase (PgdA/CDA1 family)